MVDCMCVDAKEFSEGEELAQSLIITFFSVVLFGYLNISPEMEAV